MLLDADGIMLSDISGKWLLLDADGIMLSDISGECMLLDDDGTMSCRQHRGATISLICQKT
jgi:glucan-binding YG repeat protein